MNTMSSSTRDAAPGPARVLDSSRITCPSCRGRGWWIVKALSDPYAVRPCTTCEGRRTIELAWVSSAALPGLRHVVHADRMPHPCLCGYVIATDDVIAPQGLGCTGCVQALREMGLQLP